ncbi:MAG: MBL fold metallo-hydrolase [Myxococcales bacterium]|nr:MBL fold metallo-hydrolase [Myxococcales bacterium]
MADPPPPSEAAFAARARELEEAHRHHSGPASSFIGTWARALFSRTRTSRLAPLPVPTRGECAITWIGHATVMLRYVGGQVVTDPFFGRWLYTLRRARDPAIPPGALDSTDLILITHEHVDHLDPPSLRRFPRAATVVVPPGGARRVGKGFARVVELDVGGQLQGPTRKIEVTAVAARHGIRHALGYVVRGEGPTVYVAGDTGYFDGFCEIGARFHPEVAILPISSYRPNTLRRNHLSPLDALYAFEDLGAKYLVPIHHGDFPLGYEPIDEPAEWLAELARERGMTDRVVPLAPGQSCIVRSLSR